MLHRLKSPPPPTSPPPHNGAEAPHALRTLVDNQQQTISLLVNEKASLTAQLDRLEGLESSMHSRLRQMPLLMFIRRVV